MYSVGFTVQGCRIPFEFENVGSGCGVGIVFSYARMPHEDAMAARGSLIWIEDVSDDKDRKGLREAFMGGQSIQAF